MTGDSGDFGVQRRLGGGPTTTGRSGDAGFSTSLTKGLDPSGWSLLVIRKICASYFHKKDLLCDFLPMRQNTEKPTFRSICRSSLAQSMFSQRAGLLACAGLLQNIRRGKFNFVKRGLKIYAEIKGCLEIKKCLKIKRCLEIKSCLKIKR